MKHGRMFLISVMLFCSLIITTGCPDPMSFSGVRNPNVIQEGGSETIITYQVNEKGALTTYVQKLGPDGQMLWEGKGATLYSETGPSEGGGTSALLVTSNDAVILVWEQNNSIWMQKVNSEGHFLWSAGNVRIAEETSGLKAISDGSEGVIIVWSDGNRNLNIQRTNGQGASLWKIDSLVNTQFFDIDVDRSGNIFIVWEDKDFNVFVQKLDPLGKTTLLTDGVPISESHLGVGSSKILSDGVGGAIATWISGTRNTEGVGFTGQELYAQRVDSEGNIMWQLGGVLVSGTVPGDRPVIAVEPRIVSDANSGAIIIWRDMLSIYAQKLDDSGNTLWSKNGVQIWNGTGAQGNSSSNVVSDSAGGVIVVWCYAPPGSNTDNNMLARAQRVSGDGQKLWGNDGIALSSSSPGYLCLPLISQDGREGIVAAWAAGKNIHNADISYVQKVSVEGNLEWGNDGRKLIQ